MIHRHRLSDNGVYQPPIGIASMDHISGKLASSVPASYRRTPFLGRGTQIKLSQTLNNAFSGNSIIINEKGGNLKVISKVSDKNSGDIGHPIQWDSTNSNWYINVRYR